MTNISNLPEFIRGRITRPALKKSYKKNMQLLASYLEQFSRERLADQPIYTYSFDEDTTLEYIAFLKGRNLAKNTVRGYLNRLSTMLRLAARAGLTVHWGFEEVRAEAEDAQAVYLTVEEIDRLMRLTGLTGRQYTVREYFVIACCTALRFSDLEELNPDNFMDNLVIRRTRKTGEKVIIPQHRHVREILSRNQTLPVMPSQQTFNKTVKRLCQLAGINTGILVEKTKGFSVIREIIPKYRLISSHTGRRSLATNMYLAGIPPARIMLLTGHKTEAAFFTYIRIGKIENARTLAEHPFFN